MRGILGVTDTEDISLSDLSLQPTSLLPAATIGMADIVQRPKAAVIVTSISSPSILDSPPGFHGNFKLAKTCSSIAKDPLDIARLEATALP
uniref:Uncharacterized protein n=1 Tax=Knipowitschia caucasica TaxID=637954 RepID=A0AAV2LHR1_KNICA